MPLSDKDIQRIKLFYQELLIKNGPSNPQSLSWNNEFTQKIRFSVLAEIDNLEENTILDVGCGLGDLYGYLNKTLKNFKYTGIDIVPEMILEAKKHFSDIDFRTFDFSQNLNEKFDYVFSSGALSHKIENSKNIYFDMIKRMFDISRKGVAFNVLDKSRHPDDETFFTYTPNEIYDYCSSLTDKLTLRHDYLDYDFTVYLYH